MIYIVLSKECEYLEKKEDSFGQDSSCFVFVIDWCAYCLKSLFLRTSMFRTVILHCDLTLETVSKLLLCGINGKVHIGSTKAISVKYGQCQSFYFIFLPYTG